MGLFVPDNRMVLCQTAGDTTVIIMYPRMGWAADKYSTSSFLPDATEKSISMFPWSWSITCASEKHTDVKGGRTAGPSSCVKENGHYLYGDSQRCLEFCKFAYQLAGKQLQIDFLRSDLSLCLIILFWQGTKTNERFDAIETAI